MSAGWNILIITLWRADLWFAPICDSCGPRQLEAWNMDPICDLGPCTRALYIFCVTYKFTIFTNLRTFNHKSVPVANMRTLRSQICTESQIGAKHKSTRHTIGVSAFIPSKNIESTFSLIQIYLYALFAPEIVTRLTYFFCFGNGNIHPYRSGLFHRHYDNHCNGMT